MSWGIRITNFAFDIIHSVAALLGKTLLGRSYKKHKLESGLIITLVLNKKGIVIQFYVGRDLKKFEKMSWKDTLHSASFSVEGSQWNSILRFARNANGQSNAQLNSPVSYDPKTARIMYFFDGEMLTIPLEDIPWIDRLVKNTTGKP